MDFKSIQNAFSTISALAKGGAPAGMQAQMEELARTLERKTVDAEAGGGLVHVVMTLKLQVLALDLKPELLEQHPSVISGHITTAINTASIKAQIMAAEETKTAATKMGLPVGALT